MISISYKLNARTSDHSDDETEVFYEEMKQAMSYVKCGEVVIAMGDFNAKVGYGEHLNINGQFGLGSRNERGSRLLQFCEENMYDDCKYLLSTPKAQTVYVEKSRRHNLQKSNRLHPY